MTIPPHPPQTGTARRGDLRVSDADRDRAAAQLADHFAAGGSRTASWTTGSARP